jgi:hypothetical protein
MAVVLLGGGCAWLRLGSCGSMSGTAGVNCCPGVCCGAAETATADTVAIEDTAVAAGSALDRFVMS